MSFEANRQVRTISGVAELRSQPFSNQWLLTGSSGPIARAIRYPRAHHSRVTLTDGTHWTLQPDGWGIVRAVENQVPFARATRLGSRHWEIAGVAFAYDLVAAGMLGRNWRLRIGSAEVASLRGNPLSFNRLRVEASLAVPVVAILLAWQVIARPWEYAASAPRMPRSERPGRPATKTT